MKFLVINTPAARSVPAYDSINTYSPLIKKTLESGLVEKAWVLPAGGHAFIITAESCEELNKKLCISPLHKVSHAQIIPIMDAVDFLNGTLGLEAK